METHGVNRFASQNQLMPYHVTAFDEALPGARPQTTGTNGFIGTNYLTPTTAAALWSYHRWNLLETKYAMHAPLMKNSLAMDWSCLSDIGLENMKVLPTTIGNASLPRRHGGSP